MAASAYRRPGGSDIARQKKKTTEHTLTAFLPTELPWPSDKAPDGWTDDSKSAWYYRLEWFTSDVPRVDLGEVTIRRLERSDVDEMRSSEKKRLAIPFSDNPLFAGRQWYDAPIETYPWVLEIAVTPKTYAAASLSAELIHNAARSALRLVDDSFFFTYGPAAYQPGVEGSLIGQYGFLADTGDPLPTEAKYRLTQNHLASLSRVWRGQLASEDGRSTLAVRRYNLAYGKTSDDDALVDLWIGLEALFSDTPSDITYKAAMRIAHYIGADPGERNLLFGQLTKSYNARSRLVHGERIEDLKASRRLARTALRRALVRILTDGLVPEPGPLDQIIAAGGWSA